jgi:mycoredoxin
MTITLYGADRCHKTQHYIRFFKERNLDFVFLDVEQHPEYAKQLRSLYSSGKSIFI